MNKVCRSEVCKHVSVTAKEVYDGKADAMSVVMAIKMDGKITLVMIGWCNPYVVMYAGV